MAPNESKRSAPGRGRDEGPKRSARGTRVEPKRVAGILAAALAAVLLGFLIFGDLGDPTVPDDAVAAVEDVEGGVVTRAEYERALEQAAGALGLNQVPADDDPQRESVEARAVDALIQALWVEGEAADRGISVSDEEVQSELETAKESTFGGNEKQYERFKKQNNFTEEDIVRQFRLGLLFERLRQQATGGEDGPEVPADQVEAFYEANEEQFEQPASRDVRILLNEDRDELAEAAEELREDDSEANWERLAESVSTDEASKDSGGLLEAITEGQFGDQFDAEVFSAPQGEIVGPFETDRGFYVAQVVALNEASTTPLDDELRQQIEAQLRPALDSALAADFETDFRAKWEARTACVDDIASTLCPQEATDPIDEQALIEQGGGVPPTVQSTAPIAPGTAVSELMAAAGLGPQPLPQRPKQLGDPCEPIPEEGESPPPPDPCGPDDEQPAAPGGALPPGALPLGPEGAPGGAPGGQPAPGGQ